MFQLKVSGAFKGLSKVKILSFRLFSRKEHMERNESRDSAQGAKAALQLIIDKEIIGRSDSH